MDHIFGPVNSRRLGRSLGIDLFSDKVCNLNCIYCEVGATDRLTCERAEYVPTEIILDEIDRYFAEPGREQQIDVVTVTASGEPTLHSGFGHILTDLKEKTGKKIAVLTNGTTFVDAQVRRELAAADVVIPSLDAAREKSFRKIDRPAPCLDLQEIIEGLVIFSHEYTGEIWLEILFALHINDGEADVQALQDVITEMRIDRIQLNTVARPPLESFARPVGRERMLEIAATMRTSNPGIPVDLLARSGSAGTEDAEVVFGHGKSRQDIMDEILRMLKRRPCTAADIDTIFPCGGPEKVEQYLAPLVRSGQVHTRVHGDRVYYVL
ncbi:MAG TPA: radical SAM protein [Desulfobulbus sp.]|nr:radical SAM protein [Desulfobulbus sp.]